MLTLKCIGCGFAIFFFIFKFYFDSVTLKIKNIKFGVNSSDEPVFCKVGLGLVGLPLCKL